MSKLGFLTSVFMGAGGIESFHRTFIKHTKHELDSLIVGMIQEGTANIPMYHGKEGKVACWNMCERIDVLLTWGIAQLADWVPPTRPMIIGTHHGQYTNDWSNNIIRKNQQLYDHVVCISEDTANFLRPLLKVPCTYIPNNVDPEKIVPQQTEQQLRNQYGVTADNVVFWCSRMAPEKLSHLASRIGNSLPPGWQLVMAGTGEQQWIPPRTDKVIPVGIQHPGDWLQFAKVFLHTAREEGFCLSLAEAALAGVPIVSTKVGFVKDHAPIAYYCRHDSIAQPWVEAILASSRKYVQSAKAAAELYLPEVVQPKWDDLISSLYTPKKKTHNFHAIKFENGRVVPNENYEPMEDFRATQTTN